MRAGKHCAAFAYFAVYDCSFAIPSIDIKVFLEVGQHLYSPVFILPRINKYASTVVVRPKGVR